MPFDLGELMAGISTQMMADFANITTQVEHRGLRGEGREEIIKEFFIKYLPKNLGIGTGIVIDSTGQESLQQDIVIYDISKCPLLYQRGDVQIFPVEGVYAVIEVKSNLDGRELNDCIDKILSVKRLQKTQYFRTRGVVQNSITMFGREYDHFPTLGYVFAFQSIELATLTTQLLAHNHERRLEIDKRIDLVCVLSRGLICSSHGNDIVPLPEPNTVLCWATNDRSLLFFYLLIMAVITQAKIDPINITGYARIAIQLIPIGPN